VVTDLVAAVEIGLAQGSLVFALRAAIDLARLPHDDRPPDWSDRIRPVLERFPPNSSSPNSTRRWIFSESDAGHFDRSPTASDSATVATEHAPRFPPLPGRGRS
jgi:hypothetical protein